MEQRDTLTIFKAKKKDINTLEKCYKFQVRQVQIKL